MVETIENALLRMSFDTEVNNVVALINKATGDNFIKIAPKMPVLSLWCMDANNENRAEYLPDGVKEISLVDNSNGLKICYDSFVCEGKKLNIKAEITVKSDSENMLKWSVNLENNDNIFDIVEVLFPRLEGISLGDSCEDDTIIYPHHAGEKTRNPVKVYTSERFLNFGRANTVKEDQFFSREINYCGLASMMWMYYYDDQNGFYISSNDNQFLVTGVRVETGGIDDPWMGFGFRKYTRICAGESWNSQPYTVAISCEDWHWGAKVYRKWISPYIQVNNNPEFLKDEFVLSQCYDFKKDGKIHNRFTDIPRMYDAGKPFHMKHMFIASWNRKGFDCNYAEYYPDMDLGTSMDLYNGCSYVNEHDGFVTFYINSRIFDTGNDFYKSYGSKMAIRKADGEIYSEQYDGTSVFAVMCPSDAKWQKHLSDTAYWMVKSYGATGIYLDQLGSADPFACYDKTHSHKDIGEFNQGYLTLVRELKVRIQKENPNAFLMIENCGDIYGSHIWGSLTWNGEPYDEYFNVFKYTFPEYVQVNMVNPNNDVKKAGSAKLLYQKMERAILLGSVLWIGLCKFNADNDYLKDYTAKAVDFRQKINPFIKEGVYVDKEGIVDVSSGIHVSRWELGEREDLYVIGNIDQNTGCSLSINASAESLQIDSGDLDGNNPSVKYSCQGGKIQFELPVSRLLYLHVRAR